MQLACDRAACACQVKTPIGEVFIAGDGTAHATWRIGERRNGVVLVNPELTRGEIKRAGLEGMVNDPGV